MKCDFSVCSLGGLYDEMNAGRMQQRGRERDVNAHVGAIGVGIEICSRAGSGQLRSDGGWNYGEDEKD